MQLPKTLLLLCLTVWPANNAMQKRKQELVDDVSTSGWVLKVDHKIKSEQAEVAKIIIDSFDKEKIYIARGMNESWIVFHGYTKRSEIIEPLQDEKYKKWFKESNLTANPKLSGPIPAAEAFAKKLRTKE